MEDNLSVAKHSHTYSRNKYKRCFFDSNNFIARFLNASFLQNRYTRAIEKGSLLSDNKHLLSKTLVCQNLY